MKDVRRIILLLLIALLLGGVVQADSLKEESKLDQKTFKEILPGKLVSMQAMRVSANKGNIFLLGRDASTRDLEWFLVNPYTKRMIKSGSCPFKAFTNLAISPMNNKALAFSRYPTAIWYLDLESGKWEKLFQNKKGKGLNILSISPLSYAGNVWAYSLLDMRDEEGFVIGSVVLGIIPSPVILKRMITLKNLKEKAQKAVFGKGKPPRDLRYRVDFLKFGPEKNFVFVLRTKPKAGKGKRYDYLMHFAGNGEVTMLDKINGRLMPLDYQKNPDRIIYRVTDSKDTRMMYMEKGKKTQLAKVKGMAAKILNNGKVGVAAVSGKSMKLYMGKPGADMDVVLTLSQPYRIGFMRSGQKVIIQNRREIKCFRVTP